MSAPTSFWFVRMRVTSKKERVKKYCITVNKLYPKTSLVNYEGLIYAIAT